MQSNSHLNTSSTLSLELYLERIFKYYQVEVNTYKVGLIYLVKLFNTRLRPTHRNLHKSIFMCFQTAGKMIEDKTYSIEILSLISGCPKKNLVQMEVEFLELLQYDLNVDLEVFNSLELVTFDAHQDLE